MDHPTHPRVRQPDEKSYGGFMLDSLPGLESLQQELRELQRKGSPHESAQARTELLRMALAQLGLGQTYQLRIEGERQDNLEQAILCCHAALDVCTFEAFPFEHAQTLHVLGSAYVRRVAGERRANLEQAIEYFRRAAAIF